MARDYEVRCICCEKVFFGRKRRKFCSKSCAANYRIKNYPGRFIGCKKGIKASSETRKRMSESAKVKIFSDEHRQAANRALVIGGIKTRFKPIDKETDRPIINCIICKKQIVVYRTYQKYCYDCKFTLKKKRELRVKDINVKHWRLKVFKRDLFKCVICGSNKDIQAHHLMRWSDYPEFRLDVQNGITWCKCCHLDFHKNMKNLNIVMFNIPEVITRLNFGKFTKDNDAKEVISARKLG